LPRTKAVLLPGPIEHGVLLGDGGVERAGREADPAGSSDDRPPGFGGELIEAAVAALGVDRCGIATALVVVRDAVRRGDDVGRGVAKE